MRHMTPTACEAPNRPHWGCAGPVRLRDGVDSSRRALPAIAHDELQVAQVDEDAEGLADDEDRVLAIERVAAQHAAAADREHPERRRHDAAPGALGCDPLTDAAHGEHDLRDVADQDAPLDIAEEHVVQIAADGVRDIYQHGFFL